MASKDVLKVDAFHYKLDSVSDEAFEKYVHEEVNPAWVVLVKKHNVLRYTCTITRSSMIEQLGPEIAKARPGWQMNGSHMVCTYYVRSFDDIWALMADPEYEARGRQVEEGWIDPSKGEIKVGWETVYIENGEIVNTTTK